MRIINKNIVMFNSKTNILLYSIDKVCYLIDSGMDLELKNEIKEYIKSNNLALKGIINTHSHSDHIRNNCYFNTNIYTSENERFLIENKDIELDLMYGGKHPKFLKNTFLYSDSYKTNKLPELNNIEYIDLKGHSYGMIGIKIGDILYIGDAIFNNHELEGIPYIYDINEFINSLNRLYEYKNYTIISSHSGIINDIQNLINANIEHINNIIDMILKITKDYCTFSSIFEYLCKEKSIKLNSVNYYIIESTIKNYISYLIDNDQLEIKFIDYNLYYKCK